MKDNDFDREVGKLYQKRKAQIIAPSVEFKASNTKVEAKNYSLTKSLSVLLTGGIASFGIFALISHLAKEPVQEGNITSITQPIEIVKIAPEKTAAQAMVVQPKIPPRLPKARVKQPYIDRDSLINTQQEVAAHSIDIFDIEGVQVVSLPQLREPKLSIKPVYKVMPKYPVQALQEKRAGTIRLRYQIDNSGDVKNIDVVNSTVSRVLQKSAKKALDKWKYNPDDTFLESYEIIFEFNPIK